MRPVVLLVLLSSSLWAQSVDTRTLQVENEFLKIIVNNQQIDRGRFSIETTQGDPNNKADDNQPLIFGRPVPWTSYTTVIADGQSTVFGGENKKIEKRSGQHYSFSTVLDQQKTDSGIRTTALVSPNIHVEQSLRFFRNPSTRVQDTVLIQYTLTNKDTEPHKVGLRLLLDTKLGNNDGAPLRMGSLAVSAEKEVQQKDIFPFWQAFDNLPSPNIVAQGTLELREAGIVPPDKVVLANWGSLVDAPWEYVTQEGRSFIRAGETEKDTALALYWDPITLPPQGKRTISTLYGLGGLSLSSGALSLGLTAPAEYALASKRDILIVGYVSNVSEFDAQNTEVTFILPEGFAVVGGKRTFSLGTLMRGETKQIPLRVLPDMTTEPGRRTIVFSVKSSTLESNQIERNIDILSPPRATSRLSVSQTPVSDKEAEIQIDLGIRNPGKVPVQGIVASLRQLGNLRLPLYDIATKDIPLLPAQGTVTLNWRVRVSSVTPISPTVSVAVQTPGHPTQLLQGSVLVSPLSAKLEAKLSRPSITKGDIPFYLWLSGDGLQGKNPGRIDIYFDPESLRYIHYSAPSWAMEMAVTQMMPGHIQLTPPQKQTPLAAVPLGLVHFAPIGKGPSTVTVSASTYLSKELSIPIEEVYP